MRTLPAHTLPGKSQFCRNPAQLGLAFTLSDEHLAAVVSKSAGVSFVASSTKEVHFVKSDMYPSSPAPCANVQPGSPHLPAESREHNFVMKSWATTAAPIVFFPSLPWETQNLSGTGRAAAPQHSRTNAPLSTASSAASAPPAKPSSSRGTSTTVHSSACAATCSLSHDHQAKRTQVLLDQEETDGAPHIFIHGQHKNYKPMKRGKIRIADDVHQHQQYHSCAPHYHLQQLANALTSTNSRKKFADILRRKPTRSSTMPDNNSQTLLDCWSKPRHSKWRFFWDTCTT